MKRFLTAFLCFTLALSVCACGKGGEVEISAGVGTLSGSGETEPQNSAAYYTLDPLDVETDEGSIVKTAFVYQGKAAIVPVPTPIPEGYTLILDGEEIFSSPNLFYAAAPSDDGIWVLENDYSAYTLTLLTGEGVVAGTVELSVLLPGESFKSTLSCAGGRVYLITEKNKLVILNVSGNLLGTEDLPDENSYQAPGADGVNYIVQPTAEGNKLYPVYPDSGKLGKAVTTSSGNVCGGGEQLFLSDSDGLYALTPNGTANLLALWANCSAPVNRLLKVSLLSSGEFLLMCGDGPYILRPAEPGTAAGKTTLKLAAIDPSGTLASRAAAFNAADSEYSIIIQDYSQSGELDDETALTRLNADIISGKLPDMVCFSRISPYPFIRKGLLADFKEYINASERISLEDISILKALENKGKIYFISASFDFETLVARYSDFGDSYGWTLERYLEAEKALPDDVETIHNMTRDSFIDCVVSRYIDTAVDWAAGTCSFDSPEFISLMEAGGRIRETPESTDNSYGYGPTKVGEGTRLASLSFVDSVWKLAYEESMAGCPLSFIGWPTVDGSCGSDLRLRDPVGIINGENADGCWRFIEYMLLNTSAEGEHMPTYAKTLQEKIELAKQDEAAPLKISDADADRFCKLISEIDNTAIYDETILGIIKRECAPFFAGDCTAQQAAANIQSKASIYISEQYG